MHGMARLYTAGPAAVQRLKPLPKAGLTPNC